jgi:hypothetical protein
LAASGATGINNTSPWIKTEAHNIGRKIAIQPEEISSSAGRDKDSIMVKQTEDEAKKPWSRRKALPQGNDINKPVC